MKRFLQLTMFVGSIFFLNSSLTYPCTSFAFSHHGYLIFGTNYDNSFAPGMIYVNKRSVEKSGWISGNSGKIATWLSKYGSVTFSCVGYQLAWAGMNEEGLVISTMALSETRNPPPDDRPPLISPLWMQYILDTCSTVEEVVESDKTIRIQDTKDHYLVCDRNSHCAAIEFLDGKMVVYTKERLPVRALANKLYSVCAEHWKNNASSPSNPYDSRNRFSRVAKRMASYEATTDERAIAYAFETLKDVYPSNRDQTRWSIVFDLKNFKIFYRSYNNEKIRWIDVKKFDFDCQAPVKMLDVHSELSGDITHSFKDYSHDRTLELLIKAVKNFRPDYPLEEIEHLLRMTENFPCRSK